MGVMFVDVGKYRWFLLMLLVSLVILTCAILLGTLGPDTREGIADYAYECPGDSHIWNSATCSGVQLGQPNTFYTYELGPLSPLNGYWSLSVFPYNGLSGYPSVSETLYVNVTLYGRKSSDDSWSALETQDQEKDVLLCDQGEELCWGFVLLYEDSIKYSYYQVNITFPDDSDNAEAKAAIGDVAFQYQWYNSGYVEEEMSLRVVYLVFATIAIFLFWLKMRAVPVLQWTFEQQATMIYLFSLIALNNPFFPFEYLIPGPFFPILDCFFQVIHQCVLLLYWFFVFDFLRKGLVIVFVKTDWIKVVSVLIYGIVCFTFFTWFRVTDYVDPVFGVTQHVSALVILFFTAALLFGGLIVAVLVIIMLAVPVAVAKRSLLPRLLFATIPAVVVISSIVAGLFFGVFGPVQRTAPAFVYFYTLYNLYGWILMIGYWPVLTAGTYREPNSEVAPIFGSAPNPDDVIYGSDSAL